MQSVVIIGAGGHGKVVLDILRAPGGTSRSGSSTPTRGSPGRRSAGVPVLGPTNVLPKLRQQERVAHAIVAIGDNRTRRRYAATLAAEGFELVSAIHPTAFVSPTATLGRNVVVGPERVDHHRGPHRRRDDRQHRRDRRARVRGRRGGPRRAGRVPGRARAGRRVRVHRDRGAGDPVPVRRRGGDDRGRRGRHRRRARRGDGGRRARPRRQGFPILRGRVRPGLNGRIYVASAARAYVKFTV